MRVGGINSRRRFLTRINDIEQLIRLRGGR
jgi:hypothetical protein